MATGLAKLQLLIDLKNNLKSGLDGAKRQVDKACGQMQGKLNSFKMSNIKAFDAIKDQVPGVGQALSILTNPYLLATAAVLALGAAVVSCTKKANEWHEKMAEINVTAELSKRELNGLSDKLLEIGGRNVAPLEEVPKAFNKIISAGLDTETSLQVLEPTLRAAKAGFTDVETAAAAATSVMMSSGEDVKKVFDVLFATQKEGNAEFKDIANYLPKVIPLARNVGFALDETAGAFASLTGSLKPEAATTALEGIMRALSNNNIVKNFEGMGIKIFDADTGQARPMLSIIKDLNKEMSGLSDKERMIKFDKLGLDQSGSLGFSKLMQDIAATEKNIGAVVNSIGAADKAYTDAKMPLDEWKEIQNKIKVGMIQIGQLFLPIVTAIGQKVLEVINYFKNLYNESALLRDILSVIGTVFKAAFMIAIIPIKLVINLITGVWEKIKEVSNEIGNFISRVTGLKKPFADLYNFVRPYLVWMKEFITSIGELLYDVFTLNFKGAKDKIGNFKLPELGEIKKKLELEVKSQKETDGDFAGVPTNNPTDDTTTPTKDPADDARKITGGSQTKNITINIDSFIKGFTPTHQSVNGMNKDELERWMTEMFMRVVRSAETTM